MAVTRYETPTGWFELREAAPGPATRGYVSRYWGFEERSSSPVARLETPYPEVIVVVGLAGATRVDGTPFRSFVAATDEWTAHTMHDGQVAGVEVSLAPPAARMLFGMPLHELSGRAVGLDDVLAGAGLLAERLYEAGSWEERFALLDRELARRLAGTRPPQATWWAWRRLVRTDGRLPVSALAEELGWSRRRLVAAFREHVGPTPKTFARILRFRRAETRLRAGDELGAVALDAGYYDQAHFNRDFRGFTGLTPTEYLRRLTPSDPGVPA